MTFYKRNLPHWHPPGQDIFITWRLHGSLPSQFRPTKQTEQSAGEEFLNYDRALDRAQTGPLWLKIPEVAQAILNVLNNAQQESLFTLRAYTLMVNHIHLVLSPQSPLAEITQKIKGVSAREANRILQRTGAAFWQDECFDHWIRTPGEYLRIRSYIERNPVAAGLVTRPEDWPWSSASHPIE
jgi:REP element-mobilizing transposase RayT